jgi:uncharacterized protein
MAPVPRQAGRAVMNRRRLVIVVVVLVAGFVLLSTRSGFLVDWLWFDTLGFGAVFATGWHTQLAIFAIGAGCSAFVLALNGLIAVGAPVVSVRRLRMMRPRGGPDEALREVIEFSPEDLPWRRLVLAGAGVIGVFIGLGQAGHWLDVLRWRSAVPFARTDPVFGRDLGWYVFTLPVYRLALDWGFLVMVLGALMAAGIFWARGAVDLGEGRPRLAASAGRHLSALLAVFLVLKAASYILERYDLLLAANGVVFGAGYTDLHVRLPFLTMLVVIALGGAGLCVANLAVGGLRLPVVAVFLLLGGLSFAKTPSGAKSLICQV